MRCFRFRMINCRHDDFPHSSHSGVSLRRNMLTVKLVVFAGVFLGHVTSGRYVFLDDIWSFLNSMWSTELEEDSRENVTICETKNCQKSAKNIIESLNPSVNPCDDFYLFACGGWIKNHPVPPTENQWNQFDILDRKVDSQIHELLQEDYDPKEPKIVQTVKRIYRACMDEDRIEARGLKPLLNLLNEFDEWPIISGDSEENPDIDWQKMIGDVGRKLALGSVVFVYVDVNRKNTSQNIIIVDEPNLGAPKYMFAQSEASFGDAYISFIIKTAELVAKARGKTVLMFDLHIQAFRMFRFERDLASAINDDKRNPEDSYHVTTIKELQNWTDIRHRTPASRIEWKKLLRNILGAEGGELTDETPVAVTDLEFLAKLMKLIDTTTPKNIVNYILWRVVQKMSRDLNSEMHELSFNFKRRLSAIREEYPRWRDCVATANYLPFVVGYMYVKRHFTDEAKSKAIEMVRDIRAAFRQELIENPWMDEESRRYALEKAEAMNEFIGYPDWYKNITYLEEYYEGATASDNHFENKIKLRELLARKLFHTFKAETDRDEWMASPAIANAFYNPFLNSIIFPAGVLQEPFFNKDQPEALNYGSIGAVVGHEITHAFDGTGKKNDKYGNLKHWWTRDTEETYDSNAFCFLNQYDNYRIPELDDAMSGEATIDGSRTLDENIADNGGLRSALRAYISHRNRTGEEDYKLPGLERYTPEQLFYIGFARVWCESHTTASLLGEVLEGRHSPHRFRVAGSVSNSKHFAKTWRCPLGSRMNPRRKCKLW